MNNIMLHCQNDGSTYGGALLWNCGSWAFRPVPYVASARKDVRLSRSVNNDFDLDLDSISVVTGRSINGANVETHLICLHVGIQTSQLEDVASAADGYCDLVSNTSYTKVSTSYRAS